MKNSKHLLLVINTPGDPFTIDSGASLRSNLFIKALSEIAQVDVICFSKNNIVSDILNCNVIFSQLIWENKDYWEVIRTLLCMTIWPSNPYSYFQVNKQKASIINSYLNKKKYDFIACRYVQTAIICGLLDYKDKLIIDADDNLAAVKKFRAIEASSILYKWKKQYESMRIPKMLGKLFSNIRCSFCSNPLELPSPQTIVLHNTTVLDKPAPSLSEDFTPRILFVGTLRYFPNKHGIKHFVESIFPQIKKSIPLAELQIVGDGEPDFLDYLNNKEGVRAVGRIDDLASEYQKAAVVVIPIYYGSGTSVKFVEGLLMNRPVVSTPIGARWYSKTCRDGTDYMLAHNDEEFISKTIELLSSLTKSRDMAKRGYEIGENLFSQNKFCEIVKNAIIKL